MSKEQFRFEGRLLSPREQDLYDEARKPLLELLSECRQTLRAIEISLRPFRYYQDTPKKIGSEIYTTSSDLYEKLTGALKGKV